MKKNSEKDKDRDRGEMLGKLDQMVDEKLSPTNSILDNEVKYSNVNLLQFIDDDHILKRLSLSIADKTYLPSSTVFMCGLGVFASISCRKYAVAYQDGNALPIGLYVVLEQPPGSGKSLCLNTFQKPFYGLTETRHEKLMVEYRKLTEAAGKLDDAQKAEKSRIEKDIRYLGALFTSNATAEGLEKGLINSKGFFSAISSEQGLFKTLFGISYKPDASANNHDVVLNGFDAGNINSVRVTREGYSGQVVGGIVCFAQSGSIESLLNASQGSGLSDRFLMLAEAHNLGKRDHSKKYVANNFIQEFTDRCAIFESVLMDQQKFTGLLALNISDHGFQMIEDYQNTIEQHLSDGEKYSNPLLRGAASKVDMQIMKIASNLCLLGFDVNDRWNKYIDDRHIESAINISNVLLESNLRLCHDKGLMGVKAEITCILKLFIAKEDKKRVERAIIQSRSGEKPFDTFNGNKSQLIKKTLTEMVDQNILERRKINGEVFYWMKGSF